ncbi:MAG: ATP-binding protein [Dichotomicrobium sp.]
MAQSESIPAPVTPAARPLPFESFLATDDPVWVWDGQGRRIVWANAAAARLWGDARPERLKRRRTGQGSGAPARLTELARSGEALGDRSETLHIPSPDGRVAISCVFQRLQLAGRRPGLVVRALPEREETESTAEIALHPSAAERSSAPALRAIGKHSAPNAGKTDSRSDLGVLKAIARDIGDATGHKQADAEPAPSPTGSRNTRSSGANEPSTARRARTSGKPKAPRAKAAAKPKGAGREPAKQAEARVGPSSEEMAALLARVSHEIRNPLTIILGFAEILSGDRVERLPPGKAREYASDIYRTAQLALGIADDLLGFAERASGEPAPPHDWVDVNAVIADCLHLLEPVATAQGFALIRRLKRAAPRVRANERSMRQILLNLLMNALRHGDGGGRIRVMTRLDRDGALILSVKDDGPGMTADQIAAAKAPEQARDVKQAGRRGLGLRLVLGFVRDNEGEFDIISKAGDGTDVRIRFAPNRLRMPKPKKTAKSTQQAKPAKSRKPAKPKNKGQAKQPAKPAKTSRKRR